jgi:hypothetical protein
MPKQSQRTWYPARVAQASIPSNHTETSAGRCCICGTAWPCAIWVEDREKWEAEQTWEDEA